MSKLQDGDINDKEPEWYYPKRPAWKTLLPIFIVATTYFVLAYVIGDWQDKLLTSKFLITIPFTLGALVNYFFLLDSPNPKGVFGLLFAIMTTGIVLSFAFLGEGGICIIMASPILFATMIFGALTMEAFCEWLWKPQKKVFSLAFIPLLLMFMPEMNTTYNGQQNHSIMIHATTDEVWQHINNIDKIDEKSFSSSWLTLIGVPTPLSAKTVDDDSSPTGLVRKCKWQKGIYFDEPITEFIPLGFNHEVQRIRS